MQHISRGSFKQIALASWERSSSLIVGFAAYKAIDAFAHRYISSITDKALKSAHTNNNPQSVTRATRQFSLENPTKVIPKVKMYNHVYSRIASCAAFVLAVAFTTYVVPNLTKEDISNFAQGIIQSSLNGLKVGFPSCFGIGLVGIVSYELHNHYGAKLQACSTIIRLLVVAAAAFSCAALGIVPTKYLIKKFPLAEISNRQLIGTLATSVFAGYIGWKEDKMAPRLKWGSVGLTVSSFVGASAIISVVFRKFAVKSAL